MTRFLEGDETFGGVEIFGDDEKFGVIKFLMMRNFRSYEVFCAMKFLKWREFPVCEPAELT